MSLIKINKHPSRKDLLNFGKVAPIALSLIALMLYMFQDLAVHGVLILIAVGLIIFLVSLFSPGLTRIVYLGLTYITMPIGWVLSFLLLAVFYFLLITPIGLFFYLIGRDPLCRRFEPDKKSYWLKRRGPQSNDRYFHQFWWVGEYTMSKVTQEKKTDEFDKLAKEKRPSLTAEFWSFLKYNKKWWLLPIVILLLLFGALIMLSGTAVAPFIYALFWCLILTLGLGWHWVVLGRMNRPEVCFLCRMFELLAGFLKGHRKTYCR